MARGSREGGSFDSTPSIHTRDDVKLSGNFDVASGSSLQAMPDYPKPDIVWPALSGSVDNMGYEPTNPSPPAPNLASSPGPEPTGTHGPDYGQPDWGSLNPSLQSEDLSNPTALDYRPESAGEPMSPSGMGYNHPTGLDIRPDPYQVDPMVSGYLAAEIPNGLTVINDPTAPNPGQADLQNPMIGLPVQMQGRPGE